MPTPSDSRRRHRPLWIEHALLLALTFSAALFVRAYWTHDQVFATASSGEEVVRFRGTDAWYRVRLVENLLAHFPHSIDFDPYLRHPGGETVTEAPLFDYLLASPAWIAGGGSPSPRLIETVAAWMPAILGALVTVPVYFLAHALWSRPAGLIAAMLIAVMPGRFLDRSLLGAADHHVAEVLFSTCCLLLVVLGLRTDGRRKLVWSVAAGVALLAYLLSWRSGAALPCLLAAWAVAQHVADRIHGRDRGDPARILVPMMATALIAIFPWLDGARVPHLHVVALCLALAVAAGLSIVRSVFPPQKASDTQPGEAGRRARVTAAVAMAAVAGGVATVAAFFPARVVELLELFQRLLPGPWATTVAEMRPLHLDDSLLQALWREFTTAAVAAAFGLALVAWQAWRKGRPEDLLLLTWSLAMLTASLGQRRFTYYLAVAVALLSAAAVAWMLSSLFERRRRSLALAATAAMLVIPNVRAAAETASRGSGPDPAWHDASLWLRSHTPEPFGDRGYYYARYRAPVSAADAERHHGAYGVLAWWDRGFWLLRTARRIPVANPKGHGILTAASFYLEQRPDAARRSLEDGRVQYVAVDADMPIRQAGGSEIGLGSIASMARWLGQPVERYVERYELRSGDGSWRPIFLYYPDYFRTLAVRLQTFRGRAATPGSPTWVVGFDVHRRPDGALVKRVRSMKPFASHPEAVEYLGGLPEGRHRLVSTDPGSSCVPLEALDGFRRVYPDEDSTAPVQIFAVGDSFELPDP